MALVDLKDAEHEVPRMYQHHSMGTGGGKMFAVPEGHLYIIDNILVTNIHASTDAEFTCGTIIITDESWFDTSTDADKNYIDTNYDGGLGGVTQGSNQLINFFIRSKGVSAKTYLYQEMNVYMSEGQPFFTYANTNDLLDLTVNIRDIY